MSVPPTNQPPPLPPRPIDSQQLANPMMNSGFGYGGYGMNGFPGSGMYGTSGMYGGMGYGGYGGFNHMGYGQPAESNFARLAEEQSRGAFQSIESVVNAVSSVANMLNSTHNAVYSSFRAVIGVVEQFGRLKTQLSSVVVSLALFRWVYKFWRWLLVMLKLKPANYASVAEMAWGSSQLYATVNWPAALFWVVAIGGPWLIYKCVSQMVQAAEEKRKWATGSAAHYTAQALFDFQASNDQELSFMNGETLRVAPKEEQPRVRGWLLASAADGTRIGLVPINYVRIVGKQSQSPPLTQQSNLDTFVNSFPSKDLNSNLQ
ncbi:Protein CBR-PRX-13 [Caenorhabditis briggsae]|uniref:Peroxisomal membrane protein PEX13 n=1 Tax=Caenorhabditis briggsae TaxID=6238 RepID=A8XH41_CAEBR|nr:Protein CBR-PRX-13 [Caenorhabditis briggsae]CAP31965.2 Protein CBR-PRX-13 [Caenorhabditis briggsae]